MKNHSGKMAAPIVITVLAVLYYVLYFVLLVSFLEGIWRILLGIVPVVLAVLMICVCAQRIKEIRSGEEDDLGQY